MRRLIVGALVATLLAAFTPVGRTDESVLKLVVATPRTEAEAAYLMGHFDETHNHHDGHIEILAWPGDLALLDASGIDYEIAVEDFVAHESQPTAAPAPIRLPGPDRDDYRRLPDYNAEMAKLAKQNPGLVKLFELPSLSLEGRTIYGIEIAAAVRDTEDGRPIFYIDALHHAREWPASEYTMIWAHHVVESYGKDPQITKLLREARVIAIPMVNPDGFDYSRESPAQVSALGAINGFEGYWRKNRRSPTGVTVPVVQKNPEAYGVDPNRNYAYLWGDSQGGSSGTIFDQTYRGAAPFSEPETQNVREVILSRPVTGVLTNHTYQGSVLRTGGGKAPDDATISRIADRVAAVLGYENRASVGYPTTGTTDDWAYAAIGAFGYTIENGVIGFHPPYASEVGAYWKQHNKAFDMLLAMAANRRYHSVIKGKVAGGKAQLTITKSFKTPLSPGNPTGDGSIPEKIKLTLTTKADGTFEWHVSPSTRPYVKKSEAYTLTIKAKGRTKTLKVMLERGEVLDLGTIRL